MTKLLIVKSEVSQLGWMKHMPQPLRPAQKVVLHADQVHIDGTPIDPQKYVRIKHGNGAVSIFNVSYFRPFGQR